MLCLLKPDAFRLRFPDPLRACKVDKDQSAFKVLNLIRIILLVPSLIHVDVQDSVRPARGVVHRLTCHIPVGQACIYYVHGFF